MVYCGKPSRGCQNCKTRRIKCDEVRPCCTQCRKSSRTCPGYPDEFDLIFRNETAAVKRRAQRALSASKNNRAKSNSIKKQSASKPTSIPVTPVEQIPIDPDLTRDICAIGTSPSLGSPESLPGSYTDTLVSTPVNGTQRSPLFIDFSVNGDTLPISPISPIEITDKYQASYNNYVYGGDFLWGISAPQDAFAASYFFQSHVIRARHSDSQRGYVELLPSMYDKASPTSLLHKAAYAVGLGALSNYQKSTSLRCEARKTYGRALKELSLAIKDPSLAILDETLMTILLFSLCEQITCADTQKAAWTSHVQGAVALVKLRGRDQLRNPISRRLFEAVRAHMVVACIQKACQIEDFPDPKGWLCDEGMELNGANRLTAICVGLPNLRAQSQQLVKSEKTPTVLAEMLEVIEEARKVDRRLEEWCNGLCDAWTGKVAKVVTEEPKDIMNAFFWPGPQFLYQDLNIAHIITDYRMCRLFCQAVIRECVNAFPTSAHSEHLQRTFTEAVYISQQMVDDFCSSVPYLLGFGMGQRADCTTPADQKSAMSTGAYFSAPPLYIAKSMSCIPARQRQWLLGRLIYVGKRHGHVEEGYTEGHQTMPTLIKPITNIVPVSPVTPITPSTPISSPLHHLGPALRYPAAQFGLESYA